MRRVISAGIIVFRHTREGIKYLLLYHGRNYWNFAKGKIESEERSWQTALREVLEETGLKSTELNLMQDFKTKEQFVYRSGREQVTKIVILYLAETKKRQITIASKEHEGFGWFTYGEAKRALSKHKDSIKILQEAYGFLQRKRVPNRGQNPKRKNTHLRRGGATRRQPPRVPGGRQHPE